MKFKSKIITVCLATSALIVPVQKAFGAGAVHQVKEEKLQRLVCVKETQNSWKCQSENSQHPKAIANSKSTPTQIVSNFTRQSEVFLLLVCIGSISTGLFLYIQHCKNSATVLRQNVEALERSWKISNYQKD